MKKLSKKNVTNSQFNYHGKDYHGHIAMFTGGEWISDFIQRDMWGGSAYRNKA